MLFYGLYDLNIDSKSRLSIPATARAAMDPEQEGSRFYVVPGRRPGTLSLYPDRYFEMSAHQRHQALPPGARRDEFELVYYAMATLLEVDKQGRVVLPQWIVEKAGIGKQVTLTGACDHFVLWNREEGHRYVEQNWNRHADLQDLAMKEGQAGGNGGSPR